MKKYLWLFIVVCVACIAESSVPGYIFTAKKHLGYLSGNIGYVMGTMMAVCIFTIPTDFVLCWIVGVMQEHIPRNQRIVAVVIVGALITACVAKLMAYGSQFQ